jgi:glycerol-3-phosphate O-acyltransferase
LDFNTYRDIAPYRGKDVEDAVERIIANAPFIEQMLCGVQTKADRFDAEKTKAYVNLVISQLRRVHSYDDFQRYVTAGIFLPSILKNSSTGFSVSGIEHIAADESCFYMSNHRDIILDCALIDLALLQGGRGMCEMAIGDNLLYNQFVVDLFKLNGGVTVKRTLPMRDKYLESIRLSQYFVELITQEKHSIWCAQKSGRAKDGIDMTNPAIIKMLYLSQRHRGVSFPEVIRECHLVPVAVSYEYDPNDINKGREEVDIAVKGSHEKKKYEDMISMIRGLTKQKGRIHISFGTPIVDDCDNPQAVANQVDRQIHLMYKLWPTNCFAYDYLEQKNSFRDVYKDFDSKAFLARYAHLQPEVREFVLNSFANPVRSYLRAKDS